MCSSKHLLDIAGMFQSASDDTTIVLGDEDNVILNFKMVDTDENSNVQTPLIYENIEQEKTLCTQLETDTDKPQMSE